MQYRDFGNGPVLAYRHINPDGSIGGWVQEGCRIGGGVYIGPECSVIVGAVLAGNVQLHDHACIYGPDTILEGDIVIRDFCVVGAEVEIRGSVDLRGDIEVAEGVHIDGPTSMTGSMSIHGRVHLGHGSVASDIDFHTY